MYHKGGKAGEPLGHRGSSVQRTGAEEPVNETGQVTEGFQEEVMFGLNQFIGQAGTPKGGQEGQGFHTAREGHTEDDNREPDREDTKPRSQG